MRSLARRAAPAALLAAGCYAVVGLFATAGTAADQAVQTTSANVFDPDSVTVDIGDTVTWTNNGGLNHTVTSSTNNWAKSSGIGVMGQSTTYTFTAAGTYGYYCQTHGSPGAGMHGQVVVRSKATPKPSPSKTRQSASPLPTISEPPSPTPSATPSRTPSPDPTPTRDVSPTAKPSPTPSRSVVVSQRPSLARPPAPAPTYDIVGLSAPDPTGRERGLPIAIAVIALLGVTSAHLRLLLVVPTSTD